MALTAEQQSQLDFDNAARAVDRKMEAVRIAQAILMENDRNKPTGERGITASDVTTFAASIVTYINQ
jgi:hypothetical protein